MSGVTLALNDELRTTLAQLLETHQADLVEGYLKVLRETLFSSRATIRPNMLKKIAADEVDTFGRFLHQPSEAVVERGVHLYQTGLREQPVLRMGQWTRQFFVAHLADGQLGPTLAAIDAYQEQVIRGYIQSLEADVFNEQERTRHAYERVVNRDKS